jgi:hypothetical protein
VGLTEIKEAQIVCLRLFYLIGFFVTGRISTFARQQNYNTQRAQAVLK